MRHVSRAERCGFPYLRKGRRAVSYRGDDALFFQIFYQLRRAFLFGRDGHEADMPARGGIEPAERFDRRGKDAVLLLRPAELRGNERPFEVDADDCGAVLMFRPYVFVGGAQRRADIFLRLRHRRGEEGSRPLLREGVCDGRERFLRRVHRVRTARAVYVLVDETRRDERALRYFVYLFALGGARLRDLRDPALPHEDIRAADALARDVGAHVFQNSHCICLPSLFPVLFYHKRTRIARPCAPACKIFAPYLHHPPACFVVDPEQVIRAHFQNFAKLHQHFEVGL